MTIQDKKALADARFYGAIILEHRIRLLNSHGSDKTTDELVSLADSQGITIGEAANIVINEIQARIGQARVDRKMELAAYDAFIDARKGELTSLKMTVSTNIATVSYLKAAIGQYPARQESKRSKLKQDGFTPEQIEHVLSLTAGELKQMKVDLEQAVAAKDAAEKQIADIYEAAHALPSAVTAWHRL